MRGKGVLFLVVILVALAGLFYWVYREAGRRVVTEEEGTSGFLPDFNVEELKEVIIDNGREKAVLVEEEGQWVAANKYSYPIKFSKLVSLVDSLREIGSLEKKTNNPKYHLDLDLVTPSENSKGSVLVLCRGADEKELAAVILGRGRRSQTELNQRGFAPEQGQYIRRPKDDQVYYIKDKISADADINNWLEKKIIGIKVDEIKEVQVRHEYIEGELTISRVNKEDELELQGEVPQDKEIDINALRSVCNALQNLSFEDVYPADAEQVKELKFVNQYMVTLFDNVTYTAKIAQKDDKYFLALAGEEFSPWVYVIPKHKAEQMAKRFPDLLKEKKEEKEK